MSNFEYTPQQNGEWILKIGDLEFSTDFMIFFQNNCRWFIQRNNRILFDMGFRSRPDASAWLDSIADHLEWRDGFEFKFTIDPVPFKIVSRTGSLAKVEG